MDEFLPLLFRGDFDHSYCIQEYNGRLIYGTLHDIETATRNEIVGFFTI